MVRIPDGHTSPLEVLRISTVVDLILLREYINPLEVLRISTVVDDNPAVIPSAPLEVLRISTVVDSPIPPWRTMPFGSAKNFYCCR